MLREARMEKKTAMAKIIIRSVRSSDKESAKEIIVVGCLYIDCGVVDVFVVVVHWFFLGVPDPLRHSFLKLGFRSFHF